MGRIVDETGRITNGKSDLLAGREVDYPCVGIAVLRVELLKSGGCRLSTWKDRDIVRSGATREADECRLALDKRSGRLDNEVASALGIDCRECGCESESLSCGLHGC